MVVLSVRFLKKPENDELLDFRPDVGPLLLVFHGHLAALGEQIPTEYLTYINILPRLLLEH